MKSILSVLVWFCFILHAKGQNVFGFTYYTNEEDSVIVTGVLKNSPADKAGLKVGDFLNFINDIPLSFKKKELLTKVLSEAPATNNELRFYRAQEVKKTIIHKAPLISFEFTCISGNCINGECIVESAFGYTIKGRCTDNTISGAAECYNTDGTLYYKGNMLKNKFEGNGIQYTANKIKFEGAFKNGLRQGNGKITYPTVTLTPPVSGKKIRLKATHNSLTPIQNKPATGFIKTARWNRKPKQMFLLKIILQLNQLQLKQ